MRTGITLNLASTMTTTKSTFSPPATVINRSLWHSPVPYLFGGLAAMLGLIVFALLILACSYWKLSNRRQSEAERDIESGDAKPENSLASKFPAEFEEKIVVIMAGDVNPTFLATPLSSSNRGSSFTKIEKKEEKVGEEMAPEKPLEQQIEETRQS